MQSLECRFRLGRALGEATIAFLAFFIALLFVENFPDPRGYLTSVGGGFLLLFGGLLWGRWRSRFVVHEQGVEFRRSRNAVVTRLDWSEIDELFLLDDTHFEVCGAGRQIRFSGPYDDLYSARQACLPRLERIRESLQARALR